jgi:hypothetical protein
MLWCAFAEVCKVPAPNCTVFWALENSIEIKRDAGSLTKKVREQKASFVCNEKFLKDSKQ